MSYIYNLADTWNAGGTTFTAVKVNVTDTASAAGSLLMDLQVGGVSQFKVSKTGTITPANARLFAASLGLWYPIAASGVQSSLTGTLTETVFATITVPAGAMGANGILRVTLRWSCTNSANNKTLAVRLGGLGGTAMYQRPVTVNQTVGDVVTIANRNSQSSQVTGAIDQFTFNASTVAPNTTSVDTSVSQDLVITGQLANTGDTVRIESYIVEVLYLA